MEINIHNKRVSNPIDGIYIGRPSVLGNPFSHLKGTLAEYSVNSRDEAVDKYETWIRNELKTNKIVIKEMKRLYKRFWMMVVLIWFVGAIQLDVMEMLLRS